MATEKIKSAYFDADTLLMSVKLCAEMPEFADKTQIAMAKFAFLKLDIERKFGKQVVMDLHKESFARFVLTMPKAKECAQGLGEFGMALSQLSTEIDRA